MSNNTVKVTMLGDFSLEYDGKVISYSDSRFNRSWLFLAYLIYKNHQPASQDSVFRAMWEDDSNVGNISGSMKSLVHRTRQILAELSDELSENFIIVKDSTVFINPEYELDCDYAQFELLLNNARKTDSQDEKVQFLQEAIELYKGDFLPRFSAYNVMAPINVWFHSVYISSCNEAVELLESMDRNEEASSICRKAIINEPYNEQLYIVLLRNLLESGDKDGVVSAYDKLSTVLYSNFGTIPSDEATEIYRKATRTQVGQAVYAGDLKENLREKPDEDENAGKGALVCDYDVFRHIYQITARQICRSGDVYHIVMFTLSGKTDNVSKKSIEKAIGDFKQIVRSGLRSGDVVSQCSSTQIVAMLPQANYENACLVCGRLQRAYYRAYPHSPVLIEQHVIPLEPKLFNN